MLALTSPRWLELRVSGGGDPAVVTRLLESLALRPTTEDWDEVWEQLSHQWTAGSIAFAAIPHLVSLAIAQRLASSPNFLLGLGRTVDSLAAVGPPPVDLAGDYQAALDEMGPIALQAAHAEGHSPENFVCILHGVVALSGRTGLGTLLFFNLYGSSPELNCPKCHIYLTGDFEEQGIGFQSVDSRMRPLSERSWARPCPLPSSEALTDSDFGWLVELCNHARQSSILEKIRLLYGTLVCPVCGQEMSVMTQLKNGATP